MRKLNRRFDMMVTTEWLDTLTELAGWRQRSDYIRKLVWVIADDPTLRNLIEKVMEAKNGKA